MNYKLVTLQVLSPARLVSYELDEFTKFIIGPWRLTTPAKLSSEIQRTLIQSDHDIQRLTGTLQCI